MLYPTILPNGNSPFITLSVVVTRYDFLPTQSIQSNDNLLKLWGFNINQMDTYFILFLQLLIGKKLQIVQIENIILSRFKLSEEFM